MPWWLGDDNSATLRTAGQRSQWSGVGGSVELLDLALGAFLSPAVRITSAGVEVTPAAAASRSAVERWAAAAKFPLLLWPCFIDRQCAALQHLPVQTADCSREIGFRREVDKGKATRPAGIFVPHDSHTLSLETQAFAQRAQVRIRDVE